MREPFNVAVYHFMKTFWRNLGTTLGDSKRIPPEPTEPTEWAVAPTVIAYRRLAEACAVAELEDADGQRFWRLRDRGYTDDIPYDRFKSIEGMAQFYSYKTNPKQDDAE